MSKGKNIEKEEVEKVDIVDPGKKGEVVVDPGKKEEVVVEVVKSKREEEWEKKWGKLVDGMDKKVDELKELFEEVGVDPDLEDWRVANMKKVVNFYRAFAGAVNKLGLRKAKNLSPMNVKGSNKYLENREKAKKEKLALSIKRVGLMGGVSEGILATSLDDE